MNKFLSPGDGGSGSFNPAEFPALDQSITLDEANDLIANFQNNIEIIVAGKYPEPVIFPVSEAFNHNAIRAILGVPDTIGIRSYLGMTTDNQITSVLTAVFSDGKDAIINQDQNGIFIDHGQGGPPSSK